MPGMRAPAGIRTGSGFGHCEYQADLTGEVRIVQEKNPAFLHSSGSCTGTRVRGAFEGLNALLCRTLREPLQALAQGPFRSSAYFGGELLSGGGGGVVLSAGGVVLEPAGGVVSVEAGGGGAVEVSAGGELAEPAGDVDSCLEQAAISASALTHNNRTLRFIKSPHWCNETVLAGRARVPHEPGRGRRSQAAFRLCPVGIRTTAASGVPASALVSSVCCILHTNIGVCALDSRSDNRLGEAHAPNARQG